MSVVSPLRSDQPLRVLNTDLSQRLGLVNDAHRALAGRGYHLVRQDLRIGTKKPPLITLAKGDETLRADLRQVRAAHSDDGQLVIGRFLEVDVCWLLENNQP